MDRTTFIKQVTEQLNNINVPYQVANNTDISISATFNKQQEEDDSGVILYFALLFLNVEKNTVFAYEKAMLNQRDISKDPDFRQTKVKNKDEDESGILIASIMGAVASIALSMGLKFVNTDNEQTASYPPGYIPITAGIAANVHAFEIPKTGKFCINCGAKMEPGKRFCPACGTDSQNVPVPQPIPYVLKETPTGISNVQQPYVNSNMQNAKPTVQYEKAKKKTPIWVIILIVILIIGILIVGGIFIVKGFLTIKKPGFTPSTSSGSTDTLEELIAIQKKSAVVSQGVQPMDLGNIMNGQYYFATDEYVFYSSFDQYDVAHIYRVDQDGKNLKPIFDGFGWSLVVIDKWLYFSGNQGAAIDGTYNIFRMRLDGTQVENINNNYCYGMFLYDDYLYYMKRSDEYMDKFAICRSSLDGTNEMVIYPDGRDPIVYDNMLYYNDNLGTMFRAKPDGAEPEVLALGAVKYVLGNEKIIYFDFDFNINSCNLDGTNNKLVRKGQGSSINNINAYKDRIFFIEYDTDFNFMTYGYNYMVRSMKYDGSDEKLIFSSSSYGMYPNLVNDTLMLMDYVLNPDSGIMSATVKTMSLEGDNLSMLDR